MYGKICDDGKTPYDRSQGDEQTPFEQELRIFYLIMSIH